MILLQDAFIILNTVHTFVFILFIRSPITFTIFNASIFNIYIICKYIPVYKLLYDLEISYPTSVTLTSSLALSS